MSVTGIIDALPIGDYIRDPAPGPSLSASAAHTLLTKSPKHAWLAHPRLNSDWEPDESEARQDIGTIVHAILLEGDRSRIVVIDAEDFRTKAAKEARDLAHVQGKLPILAARMDDVEAMVTAARAQIAASEIPDAFTGGHAERTMIWTDVDGVTWRSRPDWISEDGLLIVDLKTTGNAEPGAWSRGPLLGFEFDLQAVLALRGAAVLLGPASRSFVFAVLETTPPYALSLVGLAPQFVDFAERKLAKASALWTACLDSGEWPGYPTRVVWADPPAWATMRWDDKVALEELAARSGDGEVAEL
jgi:hypothetical protein